jgi:hypothetical protein
MTSLDLILESLKLCINVDYLVNALIYAANVYYILAFFNLIGWFGIMVTFYYFDRRNPSAFSFLLLKIVTT